MGKISLLLIPKHGNESKQFEVAFIYRSKRFRHLLTARAEISGVMLSYTFFTVNQKRQVIHITDHRDKIGDQVEGQDEIAQRTDDKSLVGR